MLDYWLTLEEAAAYLRLSKPTTYRFYAEGCLPFCKLAGTGQRRFKREDLDALLVPGQPGGHTTSVGDGAIPANAESRGGETATD